MKIFEEHDCNYAIRSSHRLLRWASKTIRESKNNRSIRGLANGWTRGWSLRFRNVLFVGRLDSVLSLFWQYRTVATRKQSLMADKWWFDGNWEPNDHILRNCLLATASTNDQRLWKSLNGSQSGRRCFNLGSFRKQSYVFSTWLVWECIASFLPAIVLWPLHCIHFGIANDPFWSFLLDFHRIEQWVVIAPQTASNCCKRRRTWARPTFVYLIYFYFMTSWVLFDSTETWRRYSPNEIFINSETSRCTKGWTWTLDRSHKIDRSWWVITSFRAVDVNGIVDMRYDWHRCNGWWFDCSTMLIV